MPRRADPDRSGSATWRLLWHHTARSGPAPVCGDVADPNVEPVVLPVGFEKFHRQGFLNYQAQPRSWSGLG